MKQRKHTPEQIVRKLREADRLLGEGQEPPEVIKYLEISEATYHRWRAQYGGMKADDVKRLKELEVSENTFHRWRAQYGGMKADDVKRLKELERENVQLKRIVADQALDIQGLKELSRGNF